VQHDQFSLWNSLNVLGKGLGKTTVEYLFRFFVLKAPDHIVNITLSDNIVNGYYFVTGRLVIWAMESAF
jgi:hypothetical protein